MKINAKDQKPNALCSDQLKLLRFDFQSMVKLRRHFLTPGHQITIPERQIAVTQTPPTALARCPVLPDSRLSWRSTSHRTRRNPRFNELPRSAPVYGLNRRCIFCEPRSSQISAG